MKICIVAGGTGGHISPALAVAEKIKTEKFFITGKSRPSEKRFIRNIDEKTKTFFIDIKPITGKKIKAVSGILSSFRGIKEALEILKKINPDVVLGFGGYISGPVCLAGKILKKKVFIHEQNSVMGFANKVISLFCDRVFVSFQNTHAPDFARKKFAYTGFPLREKFKHDLQRGLEEKKKNGKDKVVIFVSGGSQGAVGLNKLFIETIDRISKSDGNIKSKIKIFHQTGDIFFEEAKKLLKDYDSEIFPFTDDFGYFLGLCDIAVARGGAGTVFEIAFSKKPAIFVPLPSSAGGHQEKNPKYLLQDACVVVKQNEKHRFEINLFELITREERRKEISDRMQKIQVEDGSFRILNFIFESG